jgi:DNA-directed RNA polymerase specialized sigma24 family protein
MSSPLIGITPSSLPAESFETLLQKALRDRKLMSDLLRHSVFLDRGYRICRWHVRGTNQDAWEVFNNAYLKMMASIDRLQADNTPNEEAFFGWFFQLTLNMLRDQWRKNAREMKRIQSISFSYEESPNEDSCDTGSGIDIIDSCVDLDGDCFLEEFLEFTNTLPAHHRRAIMLRLENFPDKGVPYEKIAMTLSSEGIIFSHVTIRSWVRASWKAFLDGRRGDRRTRR